MRRKPQEFGFGVRSTQAQPVNTFVTPSVPKPRMRQDRLSPALESFSQTLAGIAREDYKYDQQSLEPLAQQVFDLKKANPNMSDAQLEKAVSDAGITSRRVLQNIRKSGGFDNFTEPAFRLAYSKLEGADRVTAGTAGLQQSERELINFAAGLALDQDPADAEAEINSRIDQIIETGGKGLDPIAYSEYRRAMTAKATAYRTDLLSKARRFRSQDYANKSITAIGLHTQDVVNGVHDEEAMAKAISEQLSVDQPNVDSLDQNAYFLQLLAQGESHLLDLISQNKIDLKTTEGQSEVLEYWNAWEKALMQGPKNYLEGYPEAKQKLSKLRESFVLDQLTLQERQNRLDAMVGVSLEEADTLLFTYGNEKTPGFYQDLDAMRELRETLNQIPSMSKEERDTYAQEFGLEDAEKLPGLLSRWNARLQSQIDAHNTRVDREAEKAYRDESRDRAAEAHQTKQLDSHVSDLASLAFSDPEAFQRGFSALVTSRDNEDEYGLVSDTHFAAAIEGLKKMSDNRSIVPQLQNKYMPAAERAAATFLDDVEEHTGADTRIIGDLAAEYIMKEYIPNKINASEAPQTLIEAPLPTDIAEGLMAYLKANGSDLMAQGRFDTASADFVSDIRDIVGVTLSSPHLKAGIEADNKGAVVSEVVNRLGFMDQAESSAAAHFLGLHYETMGAVRPDTVAMGFELAQRRPDGSVAYQKTPGFTKYLEMVQRLDELREKHPRVAREIEKAFLFSSGTISLDMGGGQYYGQQVEDLGSRGLLVKQEEEDPSVTAAPTVDIGPGGRTVIEGRPRVPAAEQVNSAIDTFTNKANTTNDVSIVVNSLNELGTIRFAEFSHNGLYSSFINENGLIDKGHKVNIGGVETTWPMVEAQIKEMMLRTVVGLQPEKITDSVIQSFMYYQKEAKRSFDGEG